MNESMCPCGKKLTDIRGKQTEIDVATKTEWRCQGCGARGHYERGKPVANEPDSLRMDEIVDRLFDAISATSDDDRITLLVSHLVTLRMADNDTMFKSGEGEFWCDDYRCFEEDMMLTEVCLASSCRA